MIEYEKKKWYNEGDARKIPINDTNLNRIEDGIAAAVEAINKIEPSYYFSGMSRRFFYGKLILLWKLFVSLRKNQKR